MRNRNYTRDSGRPAVIGTFEERIKLLSTASQVIDKMRSSGYFSPTDLDSLQSVRLGFLREPEERIWGCCSYSRAHQSARTAGARTWRVLVHRMLLHEQSDELEKTLYHEFLHSILGPDEGHGSEFLELESRWSSLSNGHTQ